MVNCPKPLAQTAFCAMCGVSRPPRPGQAADRRRKPDSNNVRPRNSAGTALAAAYIHCRPGPTTRRSGSQPALAAVDIRWPPDPTIPRSGSRAVAPSRLPGLLATRRRLAQARRSRLSSDEEAFPSPQPAPSRGSQTAGSAYRAESGSTRNFDVPAGEGDGSLRQSSVAMMTVIAASSRSMAMNS